MSPHPNLANNLFVSSCGNRRPIVGSDQAELISGSGPGGGLVQGRLR
jgi:hypothetical protein